MSISFPCKSLCLQITAVVSKITKNIQCDLTFISIELSETPDSFVKMPLVLEIKKIPSFMKTHFY